MSTSLVSEMSFEMRSMYLTIMFSSPDYVQFHFRTPRLSFRRCQDRQKCLFVCVYVCEIVNWVWCIRGIKSVNTDWNIMIYPLLVCMTCLCLLSVYLCVEHWPVALVYSRSTICLSFILVTTWICNFLKSYQLMVFCALIEWHSHNFRFTMSTKDFDLQV